MSWEAIGIGLRTDRSAMTSGSWRRHIFRNLFLYSSL